MLTAGDVWLAKMRDVLAAEREAIRKNDAKTVEASARSKEALLAEITSPATSAEDKQLMLAALATVRDHLKRNLVLLAHARDCVREAITRHKPKGLAPGARLSIQL